MRKLKKEWARVCIEEKMSQVKRTFWISTTLKDSYRGDREIRTREPETTATLVSSLLENGMHAPTLDIDITSRLLQSSTTDHYHLYIDHPMTWRKYKRLLRALYRAGLIEKGFYKLSKQRKATFVRKPGVLKTKSDYARSYGV